MLPTSTVPGGLLQVLAGCRGVFTAPTFATFTLLVTGVLSGVGPRTVTGISVRGRDGHRGALVAGAIGPARCPMGP